MKGLIRIAHGTIVFGASLAAAIPSSAAAQQQIVLPSEHLYGTGYPRDLMSIGCTSGLATTVFQNLFEVEPHAGGVATAIAFRRRDFPSSPATYPALTVDFEFAMSHTTRPIAMPSPFAAGNRGSDYRVVVNRQVTRFPSTPPGAPPYPFDYRFPFDQPFLLFAGRTAMWEVTRHGSSSCTTDQVPLGFDAAGWPIDYSGSSSTMIGQPCVSGGFHENRLGVSWLTVGSYGEATIGRGGPYDGQSFAWLYWGLAATHWGAHLLPLDLAPYGAPGCFVWVSLDFLWPLQLQVVPGRQPTVALLEVPNDPGLAGIDVFFQGVRFNVGHNAARIATSNGVRSRIGPHSSVHGSSVMFWNGADEYGQRGPSAMIFALTVY